MCSRLLIISTYRLNSWTPIFCLILLLYSFIFFSNNNRTLQRVALGSSVFWWRVRSWLADSHWGKVDSQLANRGVLWRKPRSMDLRVLWIEALPVSPVEIAAPFHWIFKPPLDISKNIPPGVSPLDTLPFLKRFLCHQLFWVLNWWAHAAAVILWTPSHGRTTLI